MPASEIDQFMAALANFESGGDPNAVNADTGAHGTFQIMPENFGPWAQEAGLPADAPKTPENQRRVARSKMLDYYNAYGRWDAVAVAWFAGPARAQRYVEGDQSVLSISDANNTSVADYIDNVMAGMDAQRGDQSGGGSVQPRQQPSSPGGGSDPLQTREGEPAGGQMSDPGQTRSEIQGSALEDFSPEVPAGEVGEFRVNDIPEGRRRTSEARDSAGSPTDSRQLLTGVLQSVSDQIAGRGGVGGLMPDMGGPEPVAVPGEQLPEGEDVLDGLGEQGGGMALKIASEGQPQRVDTPSEAPSEEGGRPQQPEQQRQQIGPPTDGADPRGEPAPGGWVMPTSGRWSSNFGQDRATHKHGGVDISTPEGTVVKAAKPGTVSRAGWSNSYGYVVYIDHPGGLQTRYAHLVGPPPVNVGDAVEAGQPIANSGNTGRSHGPHLHFEIRKGGQSVDPSARYGISERFTEVA